MTKRSQETAGIIAVERFPLPHNFEAEMALLGSLLANNRAYDKVIGLVGPDDFADERHGRVFSAIALMIESGMLANAITLKQHFEQDGSLGEIGGVSYLAKLSGSVVTLINAVDYAMTIRDAAMRRRLIQQCVETAREASGEVVSRGRDETAPKTALNVIDGHLLAVEGVRDLIPANGQVSPLVASAGLAIEQADEAHRSGRRITGIPLGYSDLDHRLGGLQKSNLYIVAARPSMGKTAFAVWAAYHAAVNDHAVLFFSLEMSHDQIGQRIVGPLCGVSPFDLSIGQVGDNDNIWQRLITAKDEFSSLRFTIDDTPSQSVAGMKARARAIQRRSGLDLVIVDHLQLITASKIAVRQGPTEVVTEITKALKQMSKELRVPVVALSQLNRGVESREDKRPTLADLRQSGSIEQDADVVLGLYRESYYLSRSEPIRKVAESDADWTSRLHNWQEKSNAARNIADALILKQRNGPIGAVVLHFDEAMSRFGNLARE